MAKFNLLVNGVGLDGSAHVLTNEEVQKIRDYMDENGINSLDELYSDLPNLLDDYDHYSTNYWVTSTVSDNKNLNFTLLNESGEVVWSVKADEFGNVEDSEFDYDDDVWSHDKEIDGVPHDEKPNILLVYDTIRGTVMNFPLQTNETPKPSDFAYTTQTMETPEYEEDLLSKVFYKGNELLREYEEEDYTSKGLTVELFTMDDMDNDEDWDEDDE